MPRNNAPFAVDNNGIDEPELANACCDLGDLLVAVRASVTRIRDKVSDLRQFVWVKHLASLRAGVIACV